MAAVSRNRFSSKRYMAQNSSCLLNFQNDPILGATGDDSGLRAILSTWKLERMVFISLQNLFQFISTLVRPSANKVKV